MDEQTEQTERITPAQFKRETYHKKGEFKITKANGIVKTIETKKFYCNKNTRLRMFSLPSYMLSLEGEFFKIIPISKTNNFIEYLYKSSYGITRFKFEVGE